MWLLEFEPSIPLSGLAELRVCCRCGARCLHCFSRYLRFYVQKRDKFSPFGKKFLCTVRKKACLLAPAGIKLQALMKTSLFGLSQTGTISTCTVKVRESPVFATKRTHYSGNFFRTPQTLCCASNSKTPIFRHCMAFRKQQPLCIGLFLLQQSFHTF